MVVPLRSEAHTFLKFILQTFYPPRNNSCDFQPDITKFILYSRRNASWQLIKLLSDSDPHLTVGRGWREGVYKIKFKTLSGKPVNNVWRAALSPTVQINLRLKRTANYILVKRLLVYILKTMFLFRLKCNSYYSKWILFWYNWQETHRFRRDLDWLDSAEESWREEKKEKKAKKKKAYLRGLRGRFGQSFQLSRPEEAPGGLKGNRFHR